KLQSLLDCEIARDTDAGHVQFPAYVTSKTVSHLNDAVEHFQLVLDQCPVSHPDHATALTNLAWARLKGYIRNDLQDIDATTSLFRDALTLRPQPHPYHPLSLYNLTEALTWRHNKKSTAADICEAAQLYHELLPLCPEGTYLRSIAAGKNGVDYVISGCNNLPTDASDEGIHLRRVVLELCPLGHQLRPRALGMLAYAVEGHFNQHGNIDDLDTSIQLCREAALTLHPPGHPHHDTTLNNLALALNTRDESHVSEDLSEAIDSHRESLRLKRLDHPGRHATLINLSSALCSRFTQTQKNEDVKEAITL
ncbi:uncharacterized protein F5147DRAFT_817523, partial [Suillus discolor]